MKQQAAKNVECVTRKARLLCISSLNVQSWLRPSIKKCHDKVATMVHWELCSKYGFELEKHWYGHRTERVMKNKDTKILQDSSKRAMLQRLDVLIL